MNQHMHPRRFAAPNPMMLAMGSNGNLPSRLAHELPGLPGYEEMVRRYSVTNEKWEVIKTSLYDSAPYPAAGVTQLQFFQNPIGQGTGFGGGTKTLSDTNMVTQGIIPKNINFLIQSIEIEIQPSTPSTGGTSAAQQPAVFGAQVAAALVNDVYVIGRSGSVRLQILAKDYLSEAPVGRFPPRYLYTVEGALSDATTAAGNGQNRLAFANWRGVTYHVSPADLRLEETVNFALILAWQEGVQAVTNAARIFVHMNGLEYRRSQ